MNVRDVVGLVERLGALDDDCTDVAALTAAAASARRVISWCESRRLVVARQLTRVSSFPGKQLADASRLSLRHAERIVERSRTLAPVPALASALADGDVDNEHIDVFGRAMRRLPRDERPRLIDAGARLAEIARCSSADEFERAVQVQVQSFTSDDGTERLARQRRDCRLHGWVDRGSGMYRLSGWFDPVSGLALNGRIDATVAALFAELTPESCPDDPVAKQDHLRALALLALTQRSTGGGPDVPASTGGLRADIVVVVDTTATDARGQAIIDWGLPVEVHPRVLAALARTAETHAVIVRNGVVIHAPGMLDLGRTTRIANRAQRRALHALYPTCAIPGCAARFDHCKLHHVVWWRHGGPTDLANLLPLCSRHHHGVHDDGWQVALTADRQLTITFPDGSVQTTGPPRRRAA